MSRTGQAAGGQCGSGVAVKGNNSAGLSETMLIRSDTGRTGEAVMRNFQAHRQNDLPRIINLVEDTAGGRDCRFEHGLCFYVETKKHKILVDSGATDMFMHNAALLGVELRQVDALILSHGHYDHAGGILAFAGLNPQAKIYLRPSAGEAYYHLTQKGEKYIGIDKKILELEQCVMVHGDLEIDDELYLYTDIRGGQFPAKSNQKLKKKVGDLFVQDAFDHEQCLVITQGEKRILMSGCAHSGIMNILNRYEEIFHADPDAVISGFHLVQKEAYSEEETADIQRMAQALLKKKTVFYTGHCTGQAAFDIMKAIMGERLQPIHSGDEVLLEGCG